MMLCICKMRSKATPTPHPPPVPDTRYEVVNFGLKNSSLELQKNSAYRTARCLNNFTPFNKLKRCCRYF